MPKCWRRCWPENRSTIPASFDVGAAVRPEWAGRRNGQLSPIEDFIYCGLRDNESSALGARPHLEFPDRAADVKDKLTARRPPWGPTMRPARNQPSFSLAHDAFVQIREDIVHG